uniref:Uncharacterized protein n=1 Tax=Caulobacter phage BL57 TaxID=3348355 RepID=A0AB74UJ23_9VIRU
MKTLDERVREAIDTPRPAWIEKKGDRFHVITKGVLFPNTANPVAKTWGRKSGAVAYVNQQYLTLLEGDCPLPEPTPEERERYQNEGLERRKAAEQIALEFDVSYTEARRALKNLEDKGLIEFRTGAR